MAFSQIARAQMRDPLGTGTGMLRELQQLEDLLTEVGQGSILDATSGAPAPGAILDEGGAAQPAAITNGDSRTVGDTTRGLRPKFPPHDNTTSS